jgi:hypothetical protein
MRLMEKFTGRTYQNEPKKSETSSTPLESETKPKDPLKYDPIIDSSFKRKKKSSKKKSKKRKRKSSSSSSSSSSDEEERRKLQKQKLEKLREERLQREKIERRKADELLAKLKGETEKPETPKIPTTNHVKQKYNSQFNPWLARQNYD